MASGVSKRRFRGSAIGAMAAPGETIEGYLEKQGMGAFRTAKWQRRYFRTVGHYLNYYESEEKGRPGVGKPKASLDLHAVIPDGVQYQQGTQFVIEFIEGAATKRMILRSASESDAIRWVRSLHAKLGGAQPQSLQSAAAALAEEVGGYDAQRQYHQAQQQRLQQQQYQQRQMQQRQTQQQQRQPRTLRGPPPPPPPMPSSRQLSYGEQLDKYQAQQVGRPQTYKTLHGEQLGQHEFLHHQLKFIDLVNKTAETNKRDTYKSMLSQEGGLAADALLHSPASYVTAVPTPISPSRTVSALQVPVAAVGLSGDTTSLLAAVHARAAAYEAKAAEEEAAASSSSLAASSVPRSPSSSSRTVELRFEGRTRTLALPSPYLTGVPLWPSDVMLALGLSNAPSAPFLTPVALEYIGSTNDAAQDAALMEYPPRVEFEPLREFDRTGVAALIDPAMIRPGAVYLVRMEDSRGEQRIDLRAEIEQAFEEQLRLAVDDEEGAGEGGQRRASDGPRSVRRNGWIPMAAARRLATQRVEVYKDATRQQHARFVELTGEGESELLAWADERLAEHLAEIERAGARLIASYAADDDEQFVSRLEFTVSEGWWVASALNPLQLSLFGLINPELSPLQSNLYRESERE